MLNISSPKISISDRLFVQSATNESRQLPSTSIRRLSFLSPFWPHVNQLYSIVNNNHWRIYFFIAMWFEHYWDRTNSVKRRRANLYLYITRFFWAVGRIGLWWRNFQWIPGSAQSAQQQSWDAFAFLALGQQPVRSLAFYKRYWCHSSGI